LINTTAISNLSDTTDYDDLRLYVETITD